MNYSLYKLVYITVARLIICNILILLFNDPFIIILYYCHSKIIHIFHYSKSISNNTPSYIYTPFSYIYTPSIHFLSAFYIQIIHFSI
jgi:hypothetical protein